MKVTASLKNYGRPARKMRDLIAPIKGLSVEKALNQLAVISRYGARDLEKLIKSAVANAKNNYNLKEESLRVIDLIVDGGTVLKRWMPRAYGNANRILKRSCHLEVVLEGEEMKKKFLKKAEKGASKKENLSMKGKEDEGELLDSEKKKSVKEEISKNWQEDKEELKEDRKVLVNQNRGKKVFRRKSF